MTQATTSSTSLSSPVTEEATAHKPFSSATSATQATDTGPKERSSTMDSSPNQLPQPEQLQDTTGPQALNKEDAGTAPRDTLQTPQATPGGIPTQAVITPAVSNPSDDGISPPAKPVNTLNINQEDTSLTAGAQAQAGQTNTTATPNTSQPEPDQPAPTTTPPVPGAASAASPQQKEPKQSDNQQTLTQTVGFAATTTPVETTPTQKTHVYTINTTKQESSCWNQVFKNPTKSGSYLPLTDPNCKLKLEDCAHELFQLTTTCLHKDSITPQDIRILMEDSHKKTQQWLKPNQKKIFFRASIILAKTDPSKIFSEEVLTHHSTNEMLLQMQPTKETMAWIAAHYCFGNAWKFSPGTLDLPSKQAPPTTPTPKNIYKATSTILSIQCPPLDGLVYRQTSPTPTPSSSAFACTKMVHFLLKALHKADPRAKLCNMDGKDNRTHPKTLKDVLQSSNRIENGPSWYRQKHLSWEWV